MPVRVKIEGSDRVLEGAPGEDLLEVLQSNGYPIATSCGGVASCGLCRVTILAGKEALVPIKPHELVHLGNVAKVIGLRLACQAQLLPQEGSVVDVVIRVPEVEDVEQRKRTKAERSRVEWRTRAPDSTRSPPRPPIEWRPNRIPPKSSGEDDDGGTQG
jgi:ferredoxin